MNVWVLPPHPGRVEIERVPGNLIDYSDRWLLYDERWFFDGVEQVRHMVDRATKQVVFSASSYHQWFLTPSGAILRGRQTTVDGLNLKEGALYEWKNGALTLLDDLAQQVMVHGRYAAWASFIVDHQNPNAAWTPCVKRRDLMTGAEKIIFTTISTISGRNATVLEITPGGDVYIVDVYDGAGMFRYVAGSDMLEPYSDQYLGCQPDYSVASADDHFAAVMCSSLALDPYIHSWVYLRDLSTPHALLLYAPDANVQFYPQIGLTNGWLGYERKSSGVIQVWRRYLDGQEEQVSAFPESSHFVATGPNGEIVFWHGTDMWVSVPGAEPVPGAPYRFVDGKAYFIAGGSLFLENDLAGGGSSTGAGAGGASGSSTSGAGGAGGSSTSGAGGARGAGGTSTSGAGSVEASGSMGASMNTGSTGSGNASGGGSSGGCSVHGERGASTGLEGLGLLGLAALLARRRRDHGQQSER